MLTLSAPDTPIFKDIPGAHDGFDKDVSPSTYSGPVDFTQELQNIPETILVNEPARNWKCERFEQLCMIGYLVADSLLPHEKPGSQ